MAALGLLCALIESSRGPVELLAMLLPFLPTVIVHGDLLV